MKRSFLFLLLVCASACSKEKVSLKDDRELIGDYDWVFSYGPNNTSESFESHTETYGFRFRKNGKVELIRNSEREFIGYCSSIYNDQNGETTILVIIDDSNFWFRTDGDKLRIENYPIANHTNFFKKQL